MTETETEDIRFFADSFDIVKAIETRRKHPDAVSLPMLLRPRYLGKKKDPETGMEYQDYALDELDELKIPYKVMGLAFGDYMIILPAGKDGKITILVIERKTVQDLINSFIGTKNSGEIRIDEQMEKCLKQSKESFPDSKVVVILMIEDYHDYHFHEKNDDYQGIWKMFKINAAGARKKEDAPASTLIAKKTKPISARIQKLDASGKPRTIFCMYGKNGMMNPRALLAKIDAIRSLGVIVWEMEGAVYTHEYIINMLIDAVKQKAKAVRASRHKPTKMEPYEAYVFFLQGLAGIGGTNAAKIAEKYPIPIDFLHKVIASSEVGELDIARFPEPVFNELKSFLTEAKEKPKKTDTT